MSKYDWNSHYDLKIFQDESDLQRSPNIQKSTKQSNLAPTLIASSTPQRPTTKNNRSSPAVEIQDEDALLDEVLSAGQDDTDDDDHSIRRRRTNNQ